MNESEQAMSIDTHFTMGDQAIKAFGLENRLRLLQEELCECSVEVNHFFRGRENARESLCEEMADVLLMMSEVWTEFGAEVDQWLEKKSARCMKRIVDKLKLNAQADPAEGDHAVE